MYVDTEPVVEYFFVYVPLCVVKIKSVGARLHVLTLNSLAKDVDLGGACIGELSFRARDNLKKRGNVLIFF